MFRYSSCAKTKRASLVDEEVELRLARAVDAHAQHKVGDWWLVGVVAVAEAAVAPGLHVNEVDGGVAQGLGRKGDGIAEPVRASNSGGRDNDGGRRAAFRS